LLRVRARHRRDAAPLRPHERGLLPLGPLDPRLGDRARVHPGEPRRTGSDRDGCLGRQVRDRDESLLLGGRDPRDGVRGTLHDAVLLRLARPVRPRVSEAAVRREDAGRERRLIRRHDRVLVRDLPVRDGEAAQSAAGMELRRQHSRRGRHRARVHLPGRPDERHLQRGTAVLPHRVRLRPARVPGSAGRGRVGAALRPAAAAGPAVTSAAGTATVAPSDPGVEPRERIVPPKLDPRTGEPLRDARGRVVLDYDLATPMMLVHFFPAGLLGLGLTALLASFMSGMAGNVTAFNTVWTYDLYQSYIRRGAPDSHYLAMGRFATVFGVAVSIAAAYVAASFNNIMDFLQLVFAFVNAPLFATFAL